MRPINYIRTKTYLTNSTVGVNGQDWSGFTALMSAARNGHTEVVKLLLAAGANVSAKNNKGETALSTARMRGHEEIQELLKHYQSKVHTT